MYDITISDISFYLMIGLLTTILFSPFLTKYYYKKLNNSYGYIICFLLTIVLWPYPVIKEIYRVFKNEP